MFHTPADTRAVRPSALPAFLGFDDEPFQFFSDRDLCSERVRPGVDCEATRFAAEARRSTSPTAFRPAFTAADWRTLSSFCVARRVAAGTRVVTPGRSDRTLRLVVEGTLWQESQSGPQMLRPGAALGEDALFSDAPGELDVRALEDTLVLELSLPRQKELTAVRPALAFELLRAAGAVIAARNRTAC